MSDATRFQECSFCGKHKSAVKKLIVGENNAICNQCVDLCIDLLKDDNIVEPQINTSLYPDDIKAFLDQYIVGQDIAKRVISVAVANHYKRINHKSDSITVQKSNVLLLGPTGSGKTLLAKTVAKYLDVPFVIADATSLTEAGYVGNDVENMISLLYQRADGNIDRAERGIIFIDEIDKISRKSESASITRDVSGEGVQQALLKLIEGTECQVMTGTGRKHPSKETVSIDTSNILFIAGGAFVGVNKIIESRTNRGSIGFVYDSNNKLEQTTVMSDDLVKYGMIPEFVGRFGSIIELQDLSKEDMIEVLTNVKNNFLDQYRYLFSLDNLEIDFTDEAINKIAENAVISKTGARSLHNELERILLPHMYGIKRYIDNNISKIVITPELVENPTHLLD